MNRDISKLVKNNRTYLFILVLLSLIFISEYIHFYPHLPQRLTIHFDFYNNPNGWMSKNSFYIFSMVIYLITIGIMLTIAFILPILPKGFISLPNKDVLLNPDNKTETLSVIFSFLINSASLTVLLLLVVNYSIISYNINKDTSLLSYTLEIIIFYIVLIFLLIANIYLQLKRLRKQKEID